MFTHSSSSEFKSKLGQEMKAEELSRVDDKDKTCKITKGESKRKEQRV